MNFKIISALGALASLVATSCSHLPSENKSNEVSSSSSGTSSKEKSAAVSAEKVKTHSQTLSYTSPAGVDEFGVSVKVENGVIVSVGVEPKSTNEISNKLQTAFSGAVNGAVVGKDIKTLQASAIGGASLTTEAFMKYVKSF